MTTTNLFQGMDPDAKPSSKVLRPPGGTSSNIFGGYEDTPPRAEPIAKGPDVVAAGAPTPLKPTGTQDVVTDRDRLFGGGQCTDVKIKHGGNQKNQGTYNPLTGADLTEPKEQVSVLPPREMKVPHTSTRVRQPPGGASSGLW